MDALRAAHHGKPPAYIMRKALRLLYWREKRLHEFRRTGKYKSDKGNTIAKRYGIV